MNTMRTRFKVSVPSHVVSCAAVVLALMSFAGCVHREYFDPQGNKCVMDYNAFYSKTICHRGSNTENYNLNLNPGPLPPKKNDN